MERHFHKNLADLKAKLLKMSFLVEEAITKACDALLEQNPDLIEEVLEGEKVINQYEIDIDESGHSLFALGQPMAVDLRLMTMILKINTDLERMGDHAVNIVEGTEYLIELKPENIDPRIKEMTTSVQKMLRVALDSFIREDVEMAQKVLNFDDEIDRLHYDMFNEFKSLMEKEPKLVQVYLNFIMISHNLERIGDLASNIAEDVIYWKQGREVRHHV